MADWGETRKQGGYEALQDTKAGQKFLSGVPGFQTAYVYAGRVNAFLDFAELRPDEFAKLTPEKAEEVILRYIESLKARVKAKEIAQSTVRSCIVPIRTFCLMNRMKGIEWGIVAKTIPTSKKYADDRGATLEEVKALLNIAPLRMRAAVLMQFSSGFRSGAFDYFIVGDVQPAGEGCAKIKVYRGEPEQYYSFITPEAYQAVKDYLEFRRIHGEKITPESPLFRDVFDAGQGSRGKADEIKPMKSEVYARDLNRLWHKSGVWTKTLKMKGTTKRQAFKGTHGLRKAFQTIGQQHAKPIDVMTLGNWSTGVSGDSYYRPSEQELFTEYMKIVPFLTVGGEARKAAEMVELQAKHNDGIAEIAIQLRKKEDEMASLQTQFAAILSEMKAIRERELQGKA